jgi:hypothetical protein
LDPADPGESATLSAAGVIEIMNVDKDALGLEKRPDKGLACGPCRRSKVITSPEAV